MTNKIRIVREHEEPAPSPLVGVFRVAILIGVWILVGLAGFTVWNHMTA